MRSQTTRVRVVVAALAAVAVVSVSMPVIAGVCAAGARVEAKDSGEVNWHPGTVIKTVGTDMCFVGLDTTDGKPCTEISSKCNSNAYQMQNVRPLGEKAVEKSK